MKFVRDFQGLLGSVLVVISIGIAWYYGERQLDQARQASAVNALVTIEASYRAASHQVVSARVAVKDPESATRYLATFNDYGRTVAYFCELDARGILPATARRFLWEEIGDEIIQMRQMMKSFQVGLSQELPGIGRLFQIEQKCIDPYRRSTSWAR